MSENEQLFENLQLEENKLDPNLVDYYLIEFNKIEEPQQILFNTVIEDDTSHEFEVLAILMTETNVKSYVKETFMTEESKVEEVTEDEIAIEDPKTEVTETEVTEDQKKDKFYTLIDPNKLAKDTLSLQEDKNIEVSINAEQNSGSGSLLMNYGTYSWSAIASDDGTYVDWTLTTSMPRYDNNSRYVASEFTVGDEFNPVSLTDVSNFTGNKQLSNNNRTFTAWSGQSASALTMSYTVRTYIANPLNTTDEYFSIHFKPGVLFRSSSNLFGISNQVTGARNTVLPSSLSGIDLTVKNPNYAPYTEAYLFKEDEADSTIKLEGAVFTLTNSNNELVGTYTTNENGYINFGTIPAGMYTLKETKAPLGYDIITASQQVDFNPSNTTVVVKNRKSAVSIVIRSQNTGTLPINGASYRITDETTGVVVANYTTMSNGTITIQNLVYGHRYKIELTNIPSGYNAKTVSPIYINSAQYGTNIVTFEFAAKTYKTVNINLKKTDTTTNLAGGVFELWTSGLETNYKLQGPLTTDLNGNVTFINVENGAKYEIRQTAAPNNYTVSNSQIIDLTNETTSGNYYVQF